jgi:regulator of protease activity HflC (stomatin/prohibitin superfamily)
MDPGLHWFLPCCTAFNKISTKVQTINLGGSSVPDARGSPLNVSAIVTFSVDKPVEALYHVSDLNHFVMNQGLDVLRRVCTKFPYRSNDPSEASLQDDGTIISKYLREMLDNRCTVAGVSIQRMDLTEIAYHPEVA